MYRLCINNNHPGLERIWNEAIQDRMVGEWGFLSFPGWVPWVRKLSIGPSLAVSSGAAPGED